MMMRACVRAGARTEQREARTTQLLERRLILDILQVIRQIGTMRSNLVFKVLATLENLLNLGLIDTRISQIPHTRARERERERYDRTLVKIPSFMS